METSSEQPLIFAVGRGVARRGVAGRGPARLVGGGRRMIENFGEFLAARNVISNQSRYDKIVSGAFQAGDEDDVCVGGQRRSRECSRDDGRKWRRQVKIAGACQRRDHDDDDYDARQRREQPPQRPGCNLAKFLENCHPKKQKSAKRGRVLQLLGALLSRKQRNKMGLLITLLRSPAFLAALFSLILVATLMVLYTLSFHHHQLAAVQQQQQQQASQRQAASPNERADARDHDEEAERHHINSRHLGRAGRANYSASAFARALTVRTECGAYVGRPEGPALIFRGVPYASPPVGRRRWTRPRPIWLDEELCKPAETIDLAGAGERPHCAQVSPMTHRFSGHEDCLYLDIFSPRLGDRFKKLPVMVYIHGGFLAYGSGAGTGEPQGQVNWMSARPSGQLASELDVIMVAFNYRLQALGFMTLVQLAQNNGPDGSAGNYGLWDQLAALNWIRRNIESFGGDPDNIVLFGPDSASSLPFALLSAGAGPAGGEGVGVVGSGAPESKLRVDFGGRAQNWFRAAWLTNPTIYYELPYELASEHNRRLLLSQSSCYDDDSAGPKPDVDAAADNSSSSSSSNRNQSRGAWLSISAHNNASAPKVGPPEGTGGQLLECLAALSAEQVIRQYLGKDDPSYRLDDENSLPIHGIFADQFVTVDRELVQAASYPVARVRVGGGGGGETSGISANPIISGTTKTPPEPNGATKSAADRPPANEISESGRVGANYNGRGSSSRHDNCPGGSGCAPKSRAGQYDLLLGSTAQAVEYWPCPRNLDRWTWDDFRRYVGTSLNSFSAEAFKQIARAYEISANATATAAPGHCDPPSPKETYLTMVSDIKQICPINELAQSLSGAGGHYVARYIVETRPSSAWRPHNSADYKAAPGQANEFAHHMWDLIAFFGFDLEPGFNASAQDLRFQAQIRKLVGDFVHRTGKWASQNMTGAQEVAVLTPNASLRAMEGSYKETECDLWQRHLGRSYAWVA